VNVARAVVVTEEFEDDVVEGATTLDVAEELETV
jgi:hypothetical protein